MFAVLARILIRHSRLVIVVWLVAVTALTFLGRDLEHKLTGHLTYVPGSSSQRAHEISVREFGSDNAMIVMLQGPPAAVERQGRDFAAGLDARPGLLVVSPWARGARIEGLSPRPGVAAFLVRPDGGESESLTDLLVTVEAQVQRSIHSPVRPSLAGFPVVANSLRKETVKASKLGGLIGIPLLLVVLLLVFRSVFAALIPIVLGGAGVGAATGVIALLLHFVQVDLYVVAPLGMMGLALGVDYSLLVVSRFREEVARGDVATAVEVTVARAARSIIPAGCGLILAMVIAALILPGIVALTVSIAVILAAVVSMASALLVAPAILATLGTNIDRYSLPRRRFTSVGALTWSRRLANRPGAVAAIVIGMLALAACAFTLETGGTSIALLPHADSGRRQQEEVESALGPGWTSPMEVVVNGGRRPVTSPQQLRAIADFQRRIEGDPGVASVVGVDRISRVADRLGGVGKELETQERGLVRLRSGISRLRDGAVLNHDGWRAAAKGSSKLKDGLNAANSGAGVLADALGQVSDGSGKLANGLDRAAGGSGALADGTNKASSGAGQLAKGLKRAREAAGEVAGSARTFTNAMHSGEDRLSGLHAPLQATESRLIAAWQALQRMSVGRSDPEYAVATKALEEAGLQLTGRDMASGEQASSSYAGVLDGVERAEGQFSVGTYLASRMAQSGRQASAGMRKLANGAERLDRGLGRLAAGSERVAAGVSALAGGGRTLAPAMTRISSGAEHLAGGLGLLDGGAGRLSDGLGTGAQKSQKLTDALSRVEHGLGRRAGSSLGGLGGQSSGFAHSAYFVLAALDASSPERRAQIGTLINLNHGGTAARLLVIPSEGPVGDGARQTTHRLESDAAELAAKTGTSVAVGGIGPNQLEFNDVTRSRSVLLRIILCLVTFIVLVPVMRSLTMPAIAALFNLLTVSASLGVLALLFNTSLLGGPGYVEATVVPATMVVIFGLAIDYEVFVFARIREEYVRSGSTREAVRYGLDRTAPVVTGAAAIMICAFLAFSVPEFMSSRTFGITQAVAVFIDAFLVRLVLVPATMNFLGERSWWMPSWLSFRRRPRERSRAFPG